LNNLCLHEPHYLPNNQEKDARDIEIPNIRWDVFELMMRSVNHRAFLLAPCPWPVGESALSVDSFFSYMRRPAN
jgi:hypothetical protein